MMSDQEELMEGYRLPIEWHFPSNIVGRYATNIVVQHTEHEFIVSFFEAYPPIVLGDPKERQATLEQLSSVPAVCVARLIVAPERLAEFVKVLQDNLEKHSSSVTVAQSDGGCFMILQI
jgi:hypothetical protein